jgi:hypothetical protein
VWARCTGLIRVGALTLITQVVTAGEAVWLGVNVKVGLFVGVFVALGVKVAVSMGVLVAVFVGV